MIEAAGGKGPKLDSRRSGGADHPHTRPRHFQWRRREKGRSLPALFIVWTTAA